MNRVKEMIATAPTKMYAIDMLNTWRLSGQITALQYEKGRKLITKEFSKAEK